MLASLLKDLNQDPNMLEILLLLLPLFGSASCQGTLTGLGSYGCDVDSGVSTLQACDAVNSTIRSCFADPKATAFIESCFCKQDALNNIIEWVRGVTSIEAC